MRKSLDREYGAGMMKMRILQRAVEDNFDHTGEFLHHLGEKKPDEDTLQNTISASPSCVCLLFVIFCGTFLAMPNYYCH